MVLSKEEILKTLLLSKFECNLSSLEKNSQTHLELITTSIDLTKIVVNICKNIESQINIKDNQNQEKRRMSSISKNMRIKNSPNKTSKNSNIIRPKTPMKSNRSSFKSANKQNKSLRESKSNLMIMNTKNNQVKTIKKNKSLSNLSQFNKGNSNTIDNIFSSKQNNSKSISNLMKNSGKKKSNKKAHTSSSLYNPTKRLITDINKNNNSNNNKSKYHNKTFDEDDTNKISSIESSIQNDLIIHKDPLLVTPISDLDFKRNFLNENLINDNKVLYLQNINFNSFAQDNLRFILKYLSKWDYINLLQVNKLCRVLINKQILNNLEIEKKEYENKLNIFNSEDIFEKIDMSKLVLTKAALKAINLLNETLLNKLFTESQVPSDDILLIYHIYFQLISHPISKENFEKEIFWKKCCEYFSNESNGKTGDLLLRNSEENINLSSENIYKVFHIINGNLHKITPSYFSKIDGTTSLFAFFIKDVLDFLGISHDKKFQGKTYWTYKGIVDVIESKIKKIKKYLE